MGVSVIKQVFFYNTVLGRLHNVVLDCHQVEGLSEEPIIELGSGTGYVGIVAASLG